MASPIVNQDEQDSVFLEALSHIRTEDLQSSKNADVLLLRSLIEGGPAPFLCEDQYALEGFAAAAACGEFNQDRSSVPSCKTTTSTPADWSPEYQKSPPVTVSRIEPFAPLPMKPVVKAARDADGDKAADAEVTPKPRSVPGTKVAKRKGTSSSTKSNKRQRRRNEDDAWTNSTVDDSDNDATATKADFPASVHGETRLNIKFLSLGSLGEVPQRFGKSGCLIPDGLEGVHQMYEQRWKFGIKHVRQANGMVFIQWTICNLTTGHRTSVTETMQDALNREGCGRTVCNNVLKSALEARAQQIENEAKAMRARGDANRAINHETQVKNLRPKRCTVGLLFFGLLHEQVQTLMRKEEEARRLSFV